MSDRQGVEIDFCPQCRGVWLDRGELDKIIERTTSAIAPAVPASFPPPLPGQPSGDYRRRDDFDDDDDDYRSRGPGHGHIHPKKKKSFLGDLFDF